MDFETKLCKGCLRTIDEIISWTNISSEEKRQIIEKVQNRKELIPKHS